MTRFGKCSATRDAQARGFDPSHFSFNLPGGRCDVCQGDGTVTVEMQFLADVELVCEECKGTRFKQQILDIRYRGKNVHEVLNMTVREAMWFFREVPKITNRLRILDDVGWDTCDWVNQRPRCRAAKHRASNSRRNCPSVLERRRFTFLTNQLQDCILTISTNLFAAFRALIAAGGSLLVIEHNLDVIKTADFIVDLGPEGGDAGGHVVVIGTPEQIMACPASHTGRYLKQHLAKSNGH